MLQLEWFMRWWWWLISYKGNNQKMDWKTVCDSLLFSSRLLMVLMHSTWWLEVKKGNGAVLQRLFLAEFVAVQVWQAPLDEGFCLHSIWWSGWSLHKNLFPVKDFFSHLTGLTCCSCFCFLKLWEKDCMLLNYTCFHCLVPCMVKL